MKFSMVGGLTKIIKKKNQEIESYEDFDTDPDEDLNVEYDWLKDRKTLPDDYEDEYKPSKKLMRFPIIFGNKRGSANQFQTDKSPEP
jgi:hypothetical protein